MGWWQPSGSLAAHHGAELRDLRRGARFDARSRLLARLLLARLLVARLLLSRLLRAGLLGLLLVPLGDAEQATSAWVHWYNASQLMHRLGRRPPAEHGADYYARTRADQTVAHT
jgi:hypothetical protein